MLLASIQRMQGYRVDRFLRDALAPRGHLGQGKALLQGSEAARRELLVLARPKGLPGNFLGGELADHTSRGAQDERTRRHDKSGSDEAGGPDERLLTYDSPIHDDRMDSYESGSLHRASVQNRAMPYVRLLFEPDFLGREGMQNAIILHIGARPHDDAPHIAP